MTTTPRRQTDHTLVPNHNLFRLLNVLAYGSGFTLWYFKGAPEAVEDPVWWYTMEGQVEVGDVVLATTPQAAAQFHITPQGHGAWRGILQ